MVVVEVQEDLVAGTSFNTIHSSPDPFNSSLAYNFCNRFPVVVGGGGAGGVGSAHRLWKIQILDQ